MSRRIANDAAHDSPLPTGWGEGRSKFNPPQKRPKKGIRKMKTIMKTMLLTGQAALVISILSGCAFTKDYVRLGYTPQASVAKIQDADAVSINVEVNDLRTIKDK